MLVWQVDDWYFHSIDLRNHFTVLRVQVNITAGTEMEIVCFVYPRIENHTFNIVYNKHSHVSDFHIDMFQFSRILLQQNYEFQLICAILCQNLVAGQWHLGLVSSVVEGG